jgi:hypothetical protein
MQWHSRQVSAAKNQHATTEELLEAVFSVWPVLSLYSEDQQKKLVSCRLESVVSGFELQVSSNSSWLTVRNLHC